MERALLFPDPQTAFALTLASGALLLGLLLLAAIALSQSRRRWRQRRMLSIESGWRNALSQATEDPRGASLPRIGMRDLPHFLEAWNRMLESADEQSAERLGTLLALHGIDRRALNMLEKSSTRLRLAAITAAGHLREPRAWEQLELLAQHTGPVTSFAAARALLRIDPRRALDVLSHQIPARGDWPLARLASVFEGLGPHVVTNPLVTMLLRRPRPGLDRVVKLARFGQPEKISSIVRGWLGSSTDPDVLMAALACIEDRSDLPWAIGAAEHAEWRVRMAAARAIGKMGNREELPVMLQLLRDPVWWVRYHAAHGLTRLEGLAPHELEAMREGARDSFAADMLGQALAEALVLSAFAAVVLWLLIAYLLLLNGMYLALNVLAAKTLRHKVTLRPLENLPPVHQALVQPVTVIVVARDREGDVVDRVRFALALDYPQFEVVVVNDGSRDKTLEALREAFALEAFPEVYWRRIPVKAVRTIYHSRLHRNLRVVDKERGGTADAINAGINTSRYPLFIVLDPRWTLRRDALRVLVEPFVDDPATLAACSTVRIDPDGSAGSQAGPLELPASLLARLQIIESLREPLFGRLGWARLNAALTVAGAAILFRKDAVVEAAGFRGDMLVEEMELIARLHRLFREKGERYSVAVAPDPLCWMPAAPTLSVLREQRMRWQVGLAQALAANGDLLRIPGSGITRWLAYPFVGVFERWGPAIEVTAFALLAAMFMLGLLPGMAFVAVLALAFALGFLVSMSALLLEELSFRLYPRWGQAARLTIAAVVENLGYRQLVAFWRLDALMRWWQTR